VARGDLSRKITVDVEGEILELKNLSNTMVDQLTRSQAGSNRVAGRSARGKLGGRRRWPAWPARGRFRTT